MSDEMIAFAQYASAFEEGFAADDWSLVDIHFDDDIVWSVGGLPAPMDVVAHGRKAVVAAIRQSVDTFDRRFDRREPAAVKGPVEIPGGIHLAWKVTYTRAGLPPFELRGEEWDLFRGGKLVMHYEHIHNAAEVLAYLAQHDAALVPRR